MSGNGERIAASVGFDCAFALYKCADQIVLIKWKTFANHHVDAGQRRREGNSATLLRE